MDKNAPVEVIGVYLSNSANANSKLILRYRTPDGQTDMRSIMLPLDLKDPEAERSLNTHRFVPTVRRTFITKQWQPYNEIRDQVKDFIANYLKVHNVTIPAKPAKTNPPKETLSVTKLGVWPHKKRHGLCIINCRVESLHVPYKAFSRSTGLRGLSEEEITELKHKLVTAVREYPPPTLEKLSDVFEHECRDFGAEHPDRIIPHRNKLLKSRSISNREKGGS